ncbi:MAG: hypothetical protein R3253_01005 [Longimicrobiales bacterium]|nr:hypothetical protein [Longimicrobiales bacterium]
MAKKPKTVEVRLLFVDEGSYHHETVKLPVASVEAYDRLIDCIREDEAVLAKLHVDVERLVSASIVDD